MVTDIICCCGTTVAGATFWWSPAIPQSLSVLSPDPETTRRPSGDTATPLTYNEDPVHKSSTQSGRRAPHVTRVPLQRPQLDELGQVYVLSFAPPLLLGSLGCCRGAASSLRLGGRGGLALLFLLGSLGC